MTLPKTLEAARQGVVPVSFREGVPLCQRVHDLRKKVQVAPAFFALRSFPKAWVRAILYLAIGLVFQQVLKRIVQFHVVASH